MHVSVLAYFGAPGPWELIVVGVIVLLLFGNRLPQAMRSVGRSIVEFKKGASDADADENKLDDRSENA